MFNKIMVETDAKDHPKTIAILEKLGRDDYIEIDNIDTYFGRYHKPYLQKRDNLNLFIGNKRGQRLKVAPPAYGSSRGVHYYFIHQYNCIYECQYCYLQGYFKSPDIVVFVNHEEIIEEIRALCTGEHKHEKEVWFHAGEFSDSLALGGLTDEWGPYWKLFETLPNAFLELRTKSVNIRGIQNLPPLPNVITSFSLGTETQINSLDKKTPPLGARIRAMGKLAALGHPIGIHCDPIVDSSDFEEEFSKMVSEVIKVVPPDSIPYISLGVVRFTKPVFRKLAQNYPKSRLLGEDLVTSFDGKVRYARPQRSKLLLKARSIWRGVGIADSKIYDCMEQPESE